MISFNIASDRSLGLSKFVNIIKEVVDVFRPISIKYEYTTDIEKVVYAEKKFNDFNEFNDFYKSNDFRFDMLHLIPNAKEEQIVFQQSQGELRVFGKQATTTFIERIIELFEKNILYAYLHNQLDNTLSRSNKYRSWERKLGAVPEYIKFYENPRFAGGERDKYLIDLESVPTHHHFIMTGDKLWFGACAVMYFSELYYKYIPKEIWEEFTDCQENVILENGLRKIVLYNDLSNFETNDNRKKQWAFRNQLGIDEVAHKLIQDSSTPTAV